MNEASQTWRSEPRTINITIYRDIMKNNRLFIAVIILIILSIAYLIFAPEKQYDQEPVTPTPKTSSAPNQTNQPQGMNPDYGTLTKDEEAIADKAIGKLLNSGKGITPPMIKIISFEKKDFSDSSLGCPQPGQMYSQAIVSGYQVVLEAQGQQYDYRIGEGDNVILCENGSP